MFKPILKVAALGAAVMTTPAIAASEPNSVKASAQAEKVKSAPPQKPVSEESGMLPAAVLLSGVVLVTLANRRRNLQKVLN